MLQKFFIFLLALALIIINSMTIYFYAGAQSSDEKAIYQKLFDKLLANPNLNETDGSLRESSKICVGSDCYRWSELDDGNANTFPINWQQVNKGEQGCSTGYAFSKIGDDGATTCVPVDVCYIRTYSQALAGSANPRTYCNDGMADKQNYYMYPDVTYPTRNNVDKYGAMVCCKKWFKN